MNIPDDKAVIKVECILEKRFAESTEGKVTIITKSIVEGSVFEKITIPALLNNKKAVLFFED